MLFPSLFVTVGSGMTEHRLRARLLSASHEKLEKTVESSQNLVTSEQRQHFEDAGTAGASRHRHSGRVNERTGFRARG